MNGACQILTTLMLALPTVGCHAVAAGDRELETEAKRPRCTIEFGSGHRFEIEVAATQPERAKGLSGRRAETGMAFVWPIAGVRQFWMADTSIPLRLLWIGEGGDVVDTVDMEPMSETIHSSPVRLRMAVEVPVAWMAKRPVDAGDRIESTDCGAY